MNKHDARLRTLAALLTLALAACGRDATENAAATPARPVVPANEYTAAVSIGAPPAAAATLEFKLAGKPKVGEAVGVSLKIVAKGELSRVDLAFAADDGLALSQTQELQVALGALTAAQPQMRDVLVTPTREGVFLLKVTVTTEMAGQTPRRTEYAVPVMVASEATAPSAPPAATPVPAGG